MTGKPTWEFVERTVEKQRRFLRPVRADAPGMCPTCCGAVPSNVERCGKCATAYVEANGALADVVVPITYRTGRGTQHDHDLRSYKAAHASEAAKTRLLCLFWHFGKYHAKCLRARVGVRRFTHVAFVPSTKLPHMRHPLQELLQPVVPNLSLVELTVNTDIPTSRRELHPDWFKAPPVPGPQHEEAAVLLVDDTWVTGARAQSAAYRLKQAGAARVATLVLARQVNPDWPHSWPLLDAVEGRTFDPAQCVHHVT